MKQITKIMALLALVLFFTVTTSKAQEIYVRARLSPPARYVEIERNHPPRPSERHVWIGGEWVVHGGQYVYDPGHWGVPPRGYHVWVRGRWIKRTYQPGYKWINGHWE